MITQGLVVDPIDCVIHLAAEAGITDCEEYPYGAFRANVSATAEIIRFCETNKVRLVFASTSALYGEPEWLPINEDHPLKPVGVYGKTKLWCEELLQWSECRWTAFRFFNVCGSYAGFGEREGVDHILPKLIKSVRDGVPFVVNGTDYDTRDGTCLRDYVNVKDIACALLDAVEDTFDREVFNLGTGTGYTVLEMVKEFNGFLESKEIPTVNCEKGPRRKGDAPALVCDYEKAYKKFGWEPIISLSESLAQAWEVFT